MIVRVIFGVEERRRVVSDLFTVHTPDQEPMDHRRSVYFRVDVKDKLRWIATKDIEGEVDNP